MPNGARGVQGEIETLLIETNKCQNPDLAASVLHRVAPECGKTSRVFASRLGTERELRILKDSVDTSGEPPGSHWRSFWNIQESVNGIRFGHQWH